MEEILNGMIKAKRINKKNKPVVVLMKTIMGKWC